MRIRSRLLNRMAGGTLGVLTRAWAATIDFEMHVEDPAWYPLLPDCPRPYIVSTWHDTMMLPIMLRRTIRQRTVANRMTTLVSRHQDGSFLTYAMRGFYLGTVRGSTNRGGIEALRTLIKEAREQHVCMTPDGPRGPRRQISPGIISLASLSGVPILPCLFMGENCWRVDGSWTDLIVPKPWSRVHGLITAPLFVPPRLSRDGLAEFQSRLQAEMDRSQARVDEFAGVALPSLVSPLSETPALQTRTAGVSRAA